MATPVLYSFRRCPYAIRARLVLFHSRICFELREVLLKDKPQAMIALSSKGTVPVLQLPDRVLDESLDIMAWSLQQSDPHQWARSAAWVNYDWINHPLIEENDGEFKFYLDRYKYFDRYPECSQDDYLHQCLIYIEKLEAQLQQSRYLDGAHLSVIDLAILPFVRQFAFVNKPVFDNLNFPAVQEWLESHLQSDMFNHVMEKYPVWQQGNSGVTINGCSD